MACHGAIIIITMIIIIITIIMIIAFPHSLFLLLFLLLGYNFPYIYTPRPLLSYHSQHVNPSLTPTSCSLSWFPCLG